MDLSRIARGGTPITLDKPRVVFFDKTATWLLFRKYGNGFAGALYSAQRIPAADGTPARIEIELKDMDALHFFLWAGLQADANAHGETLTMEEVEDFLKPLTFQQVFDAVVLALTRGIETPPGKDAAATASPAAAAADGPGPTKVSTMQTRSASPSPSSTKRRRSSGRKR